MGRTTRRLTLRAGVVMMVVAAVAIGGSIVVWLALAGPSDQDAVVFDMPGAVTTDLTAGEWALYSREVDGRQKVAYGDQVAIDGPGSVATEERFGPTGDPTTIGVDGTTYHVFLRLDVPADGSYRIAVADGSRGRETPVVVGHYDDDGTLAAGVIAGVLGGSLLGAVGLLTVVIALLLSGHGRRPVPA